MWYSIECGPAYGMGWFGLVCGMIWMVFTMLCGMVCGIGIVCGLVWFFGIGMVWYGMVWYGMIWYSS